jgi:hypothetical protein
LLFAARAQGVSVLGEPGSDLSTVLGLDFNEAITGSAATVTLDVLGPCGDCKVGWRSTFAAAAGGMLRTGGCWQAVTIVQSMSSSSSKGSERLCTCAMVCFLAAGWREEGPAGGSIAAGRHPAQRKEQLSTAHQHQPLHLRFIAQSHRGVSKREFVLVGCWRAGVWLKHQPVHLCLTAQLHSGVNEPGSVLSAVDLADTWMDLLLLHNEFAGKHV